MAHLRAAAHNLTDSLSSECSTFQGYAYTGLWEHIDRLPEHRLELDLLTGSVLSNWVPSALQEHLRTFARYVPQFLREQRCDPAEVLAIRVLFRSTKPLPAGGGGREALVSVVKATGETAVDRYIGNPLRRGRYLDVQGRVRPDRRRPLEKASG